MTAESNDQKPPQTEEPAMVTILETELEQLKKESAEFKDKYFRQLAEMENARKRMQKERQDQVQYAVANTVVDFLNPIDHMENALKFTQQMSDEVKNWGLGFQMILTQFKDALTNNGVVPFSSEGKPFDPHIQEAIEMIATDKVAPGIVVEETLKGYKMGDRVIRPARVKVAKAIVEAAEKSEPNEAPQEPNNKSTKE